jgi:hypothetical protein
VNPVARHLLVARVVQIESGLNALYPVFNSVHAVGQMRHVGVNQAEPRIYRGQSRLHAVHIVGHMGQALLYALQNLVNQFVGDDFRHGLRALLFFSPVECTGKHRL